MTVTEIIAALTPYTGHYPRAAVEEAVAQREAITPHLLACLKQVAENPKRFAVDPGYMLHQFAVHMLAYFREKRAYPVIVRVFRAAGNSADGLFGETITERLKNILASVYDGDPDPIDSLILDANADEFARGAAVEAYLVLAYTGLMSRAEITGRYREFFRGKLPRTPNQVWNALVCAVADLPAPELIDEVKRAYDEGLADEGVARFEVLKQDALTPLERKRADHDDRFDLVSDPDTEMSWWVAFSLDNDGVEDDEEEESEESEWAPAEGILDTSRLGVVWQAGMPYQRSVKIGRNDLCPCGSGKKYKKCCLGKTKE